MRSAERRLSRQLMKEKNEKFYDSFSRSSVQYFKRFNDVVKAPVKQEDQHQRRREGSAASEIHLCGIFTLFHYNFFLISPLLKRVFNLIKKRGENIFLIDFISYFHSYCCREVCRDGFRKNFFPRKFLAFAGWRETIFTFISRFCREVRTQILEKREKWIEQFSTRANPQRNSL